MKEHWRQIHALTQESRRHFLSAARDPARAQERLLNRIITANARTRFGREHGFDACAGPDDFRARTPVNRYRDLAPYIRAMMNGEENVLCHEPVTAFDLTSGSTSARKIIPYTPSGIAAFRSALMTWMADVLEAMPEIMSGRFYWALSPATGKGEKTEAGAPIGPLDDAVFFGPRAAKPLTELSVTPPALALERNVTRWRTRTLCHLLGARDLTLISIWSPTFLSALLRDFTENPEPVLRALADGGEDDPRDPRRAAMLEDMLSRGGFRARRVWPNLRLVSCWTHAGARRFVPALRAALPHSRIQGKGLMSTEAMVSIPLAGARHPVLALTSAFFEFRDIRGGLHLAHELARGGEYAVIVTTPGGLYRYDTGDIVRVRGFWRGLPQLEFTGRENLVSDMCGEKLAETFVLECLRDETGFVLAVPVAEPSPHYALVLDRAERSGGEAARLAEKVEKAFRANPHYAHARNMGQLGGLEALRVHDPLRRVRALAGNGAGKAASLKTPVLSAREDWHILLREWGKK